MSSSTTPNSKHNEIVKRKACEVGNGGERYKTINSVEVFSEVNYKTYGFMKCHKIGYPQMQVLLHVCTYWNKYHKGISAYMISKYIEGATPVSVISGTVQKLRDLLQAGHIEVVGNGRSNARLYSPTLRTLQELSSLLVA